MEKKCFNKKYFILLRILIWTNRTLGYTAEIILSIPFPFSLYTYLPWSRFHTTHSIYACSSLWISQSLPTMSHRNFWGQLCHAVTEAQQIGLVQQLEGNRGAGIPLLQTWDHPLILAHQQLLEGLQQRFVQYRDKNKPWNPNRTSHFELCSPAAT